MAKEYLKVGSALSEGVWGDVFVYFGGFGGGADGFLQEAFVRMVAHGLFALTPDPSPRRKGGNGERGSREEVLPCGFAGGIGVFAGEGVGEVDFAEAVPEVGLVDALDGFDLFLEGGDDGIGQDGGAVVFAFSVADDNLMVAEVYVFDAQSKTFHETQSGAVEDLCHTCTCAALRRKCRCELGNAAHFADDGKGFLLGEDNGKGFGFLGADDVGGRSTSVCRTWR